MNIFISDDPRFLGPVLQLYLSSLYMDLGESSSNLDTDLQNGLLDHTYS